MRKIRQGMFETNSSSSHSLTIAAGPCKDNLRPGTDGVIRIYGDEFGWGPDTFTDAATKASYCLTWAHDTMEFNRKEGERLQEMLREVIQEVTGAKVEFVAHGGDEFYPWGYIDHRSGPREGGDGVEAFASKESLKRFIFNRKSVLVIDNDNR